MSAPCGACGPGAHLRVRRTWFLVGFLVISVSALDVHAQLPRIDPSGRSGTPPPLEREKPLERKPSPLLPTPTPPVTEEEKAPASLVRVFVRQIRLVGNTVFSAADLAHITDTFLNRELTTEDLESLRLALTLHYVDAGYVTSGAVIPDQTVAEGVITVRLIEGKLTRIDIEGTERYWPGYFRDRIALAAGPPVNIHVLQERLQLLQQDPRLERLNVELRPGVVRGESEAHVKVAEASPFKAWLEFNNFQSPTVGAERFLGTISHQNLTGHGDPLTVTYGASEGLDPLIDVFYSLPITAYDTAFNVTYRRNDVVVVEEPFADLNIESESEIVGLTLLQPVYRTLNHQVTLALTGEHLFNKTLLDGVPFSFVEGFTNGEGTVSALRLIPEWIYRTQTSVLAVRSRFSVGLDVLGATNNSGPDETTPAGTPVADGQFFSWLGQVQAVQRFDQWWGLQVLGRFDIQLADDRLFPLEQFPVGGRFSVRGFRENTIVTDNAMIASLETRIPVLRSATGDDILQIAPFFDYGKGWNDGNQPTASSIGFLASIGFGLRWNLVPLLPEKRAHFEVYWGNRLNSIQNNHDDAQDFGFHLQLVVQAL